MGWLEKITLAFVWAARAFDAFGLRTRLRQDGDAFGALPLLLERAAPCKLYQRGLELAEIGLSPKHHVAEDDRGGKARKVSAPCAPERGEAHASHASIFRILLLTGCRKSEIASLAWDEIDFQRKVLVLPELRSKTGARRIPLSDEVLEELKQQPRISDFVFPAIKTDRTAKGERPTVGLRRSWLRVCKTAKIEGVRIHDLRHSFASFAVEQGESLYVLGKALGHRKASTTERYAHLRDDPVRDLVERISRHVAAARSTPDEAV